MPELSITMLIFGAGLLAGLTNAIAGGGTFFTFPTLIAAGLPPVVANASNAVAVWPGHLFAAIGYRRELSNFAHNLVPSAITALLGGTVGALLLTYIGNKTFSKLIPFLILFATLLFAFGRNLNEKLFSRDVNHVKKNITARLVEFIIAIYGGFFGAGQGVMLIAGLSMLGIHDIQANNALKNLLATLTTTVTVFIFVVSGLVSWPHTIVAFIGAAIGGLCGARLARLISELWLRRIVILIGALLSIHYFIKYY